MTRWMPFVVAAVLGSLASGLRAEERTWTAAKGDFKVTGTFVRERDGAIDIRLSDGRLVQIQSENLSLTDRDFVAAGGRQPASQPPKPGPGRAGPPAGGPKSSSGSAEGGSQVVTAEGSGLDKEAAVRDACRAAIRQVVGEVVGAETVVENDRLIKDEILVYSDGLVERHELIEERREDGLVRVTIKATVKRRSLIQKLTAAKITVKVLDDTGEDIVGRVWTDREAAEAAAAMVKKSLVGFPSDQLEARVVSWKPVEDEGTHITLEVQVEISPSKDAYQNFQERLCRRLADVAKLKGEFSTVMEGLDPMYTDVSQQPCLGTDRFSEELAVWMSDGRATIKEPAPGKFPMIIAVATHTSADYTRMEWQYYVLDAIAGDACFAALRGEATCKLTFQDQAGDFVAADRFRPQVDLFISTDGRSTHPSPWAGYLAQGWHRHSKEDRLFGLYRYQPHEWSKSSSSPHPTAAGEWQKPALTFVAPVFFGFDSGYADETVFRYVPKVILRRKVRLTEAEVRPIKKVQSELTFRNVE